MPSWLVLMFSSQNFLDSHWVLLLAMCLERLGLVLELFRRISKVIDQWWFVIPQLVAAILIFYPERLPVVVVGRIRCWLINCLTFVAFTHAVRIGLLIELLSEVLVGHLRLCDRSLIHIFANRWCWRFFLVVIMAHLIVLMSSYFDFIVILRAREPK